MVWYIGRLMTVTLQLLAVTVTKRFLLVITVLLLLCYLWGWFIIVAVFFLSLAARRKKIEEIGKMTALSQEEIISNTKTVVQVRP